MESSIAEFLVRWPAACWPAWTPAGRWRMRWTLARGAGWTLAHWRRLHPRRYALPRWRTGAGTSSPRFATLSRLHPRRHALPVARSRSRHGRSRAAARAADAAALQHLEFLCVYEAVRRERCIGKMAILLDAPGRGRACLRYVSGGGCKPWGWAATRRCDRTLHLTIANCCLVLRCALLIEKGPFRATGDE